jgi:hypothetical protein
MLCRVVILTLMIAACDAAPADEDSQPECCTKRPRPPRPGYEEYGQCEPGYRPIPGGEFSWDECSRQTCCVQDPTFGRDTGSDDTAALDTGTADLGPECHDAASDAFVPADVACTSDARMTDVCGMAGGACTGGYQCPCGTHRMWTTSDGTGDGCPVCGHLCCVPD